MQKTALITGAGGVIGKTIGWCLARDRFSLILSGRSPESLKKAAEEIRAFGAPVSTFVADVSEEHEVKKLMDHAHKEFGSLDALVTAAGIYGEIGTVEQCDPARWLDAIEVNLFGTMLSVKYALPLLKKASRRGKIIAFAGGGDGALPHFTSYAASKGAVLRFVESVSLELAPYRIDINAISPGLVNSGFVEDLITAGPERAGKEKYEAALREVSGKAEVTLPEKAGMLAVFLASEKSDGITGKNISARWDNWSEFPRHLEVITQSDLYNWRRIKPKDRGYEW